MFLLTFSHRCYEQFCIEKVSGVLRKKGYIPEMFSPYNALEITDVAPTITTQCGSTTSSATVLIIEKIEYSE
jgi:hypothetical protein